MRSFMTTFHSSSHVRVGTCVAASVMLLTLLPALVIAQGNDAVYRIKKSGGSTRLSGTIEQVTPTGVTLKTARGTDSIPAAEIEKVVPAGEPAEVDRARNRIESGRFDDAISELESVDAGASPLIKAEVDFLRAYASAKIALGGGSVTSKEAGSAISGFLRSNADSYHLVPAMDMMGQLAVAAGSLDFAAQQFNKLTQSGWPEYVFKGQFQEGETLIKQEKYADAIARFDAILAAPSNDDIAQQYKLLAKVEKAKAQALAGDAEAAIPVIEAVVREESADNTELFAYAYNAWGTSLLKAGKVKEAREKFLLTELLFTTQPEPHAEAAWQLSKIWAQLGDNQRATQARDMVKDRYRNSWWAKQL